MTSILCNRNTVLPCRRQTNLVIQFLYHCIILYLNPVEISFRSRHVAPVRLMDFNCQPLRWRAICDKRLCTLPPCIPPRSTGESRGPTVSLLGATIGVTAWLGGLPRNQASPAALARTVEDLTLRGSIFSRTSDVATSGNRKYAL